MVPQLILLGLLGGEAAEPVPVYQPHGRTINDIIHRALRMLTGLGPTRTISAPQASQGLIAFQDMILTMPGISVGGSWSEVIISADYVAGEDQRIIKTLGTETVTLPNLIYTDTGLGVPTADVYSSCEMRGPADGTRVQVVDRTTGLSEFHIWRADRAHWVTIQDLILSDESPFGAQMDAFLPAMLAVELQPEYGAELQPATIAKAEQGRAAIAMRYRRRVKTGVDPVLLRLTAAGRFL